MKILTFILIVLLGFTCSSAQAQDNVKNDKNSISEPESPALEFVYLGRGDAIGFRAQSLYLLSTVKSNWATAWETCATKYGGHLVAIDTYKEDDIVAGYMIGQRLGRIWTAGAYDTSTNRWIWANNYNFIYEFDRRWNNGKPSISNEYSRLALVKVGFKSVWESVTEHEYMDTICEID